MLFEPHQQAADTVVFCLFVFLLGWRVVKNSNIVIYELEKKHGFAKKFHSNRKTIPINRERVKNGITR